MMVAAPRPEANASRHGEACPRFMAAIKTPKKTWNEEEDLSEGHRVVLIFTGAKWEL